MKHNYRGKVGHLLEISIFRLLCRGGSSPLSRFISRILGLDLVPAMQATCTSCQISPPFPPSDTYNFHHKCQLLHPWTANRFVMHTHFHTNMRSHYRKEDSDSYTQHDQYPVTFHQQESDNIAIITSSHVIFLAGHVYVKHMFWSKHNTRTPAIYITIMRDKWAMFPISSESCFASTAVGGGNTGTGIHLWCHY